MALIEEGLMPVGHLANRHLARTVTVMAPGGPATGLLVAVSHHADIIYNPTLSNPDPHADPVPGRSYTSVTLLGWGTRELDPATAVEVLR